jgi:Right handed beta helix region
MDHYRRAFVAAVSVSMGLGLGITDAHAAAPSNLQVDNSSASCTDTGSGAGSFATPFCTIQAAVNAAIPGDNVDIAPGTYVGAVDIKSSGTASAPIDILSQGTGPVTISDGSGQTGPPLTLDGASYVNIYGGLPAGTSWPYSVPGVSVASALVTGSSHITLDGLTLDGLNATGTTANFPVEISGSSSDVSLTHSALSGSHGGVLVDPGSSGDAISANVITSQTSGIEIEGASNTAITSNTLWGQSAAGNQIEVTAGATGTAVEDNIATYPGTVAGTGAAISVDSSSAAGTTEDYNVVWPDKQGTSTALESAYSWSGTDYSSEAAFNTATGQGKHDLVADPKLEADSPFTDYATAPQFNSANSAAPGWLTYDFAGSYCQGDAYAAVTGAGGQPDCARGAVQQAFTVQQEDDAPNASGQLGVNLTTSVFGEIYLKGSWSNIAPEPTPAVSQVIAWGDGTTSTLNPTSVNVGITTPHTYAKPGTYTITDTLTAVETPSLVKSWSFATTAAPAGTLFALTRASNGTWSTGTTPGDSTGIANVAITGMPDGSTQLVAVTTAGTVEHDIYGNVGVQQGWRTPPQPGVAVKSVGIAGMPNGSSQLIAITSTGTLLHIVRNANGTWQSAWGTPAGSTNIAQAAITAMPDGSSQLVAVTTTGALEHNIRNANGTWQGWRTLTQPGITITDASIAGMPNGSTQLIEITTTGVLKHNIRNTNGTWQASGWGSPAGSTGIAQAAITALPNGDSQLAAVTTNGVLEHNIRHANGTWQPTGWANPPQTDQVLAAADPGIAGMPNGSSQITELSAN